MKFSEIRWKGMSLATLMKGIAQELGTENPEEFLQIVRTDAGRVMRISGIGRRQLWKIPQAFRECSDFRTLSSNLIETKDVCPSVGSALPRASTRRYFEEK